ncbi:predicted protein [Botrytis cinerea T4]|uniref:Uncharacterized protein n=1 Tax=Botryotinia fuckeliana (strain T4) TaxID=999810 RepID=G2YXV0_BOTF4|nr:predicted protein [Botrytis cinerea T4]
MFHNTAMRVIYVELTTSNPGQLIKTLEKRLKSGKRLWLQSASKIKREKNITSTYIPNLRRLSFGFSYLSFLLERKKPSKMPL